MKYSYDNINNELNIDLCEELDVDSCKVLRNIVDGYILKFCPNNCNIDMSRVSFMDSSGLGFITGRYNLTNMLGCNLVIKNPNENIKRLISMSDVSKYVKVV